MVRNGEEEYTDRRSTERFFGNFAHCARNIKGRGPEQKTIESLMAQMSSLRRDGELVVDTVTH